MVWCILYYKLPAKQILLVTTSRASIWPINSKWWKKIEECDKWRLWRSLSRLWAFNRWAYRQSISKKSFRQRGAGKGRWQAKVLHLVTSVIVCRNVHLLKLSELKQTRGDWLEVSALSWADVQVPVGVMYINLPSRYALLMSVGLGRLRPTIVGGGGLVGYLQSVRITQKHTWSSIDETHSSLSLIIFIFGHDFNAASATFSMALTVTSPSKCRVESFLYITTVLNITVPIFKIMIINYFLSFYFLDRKVFGTILNVLVAQEDLFHSWGWWFADFPLDLSKSSCAKLLLQVVKVVLLHFGHHFVPTS